TNPAVQSQTVENAAHAVLAHAEVEISPGEILPRQVMFAFRQGVIGRRQISRAAKQHRKAWRDGVQDRSGGSTSSDRFGSGIRWQVRVPTFRQLAAERAVEDGRQFRVSLPVSSTKLCPLFLLSCACRGGLLHEFARLVGNPKLLIEPPTQFLLS